MKRCGAGIALGLLMSGAWCASDLDEEKLRAMDQRCEEVRAAKLAPEREKLARACVREKRYVANPEQDCVLEMSTYGNTFSGARGAAIQGKYYNLPECVLAAEAWKKWEASRPWKN